MRQSSVQLAILEVLAGEGDSHLSALEIYERLKARLPAIAPSTVYRALERLTQQGLVSVSDMGQGVTLYERVGQALHHHLVCTACGRIFTIDHAQVGPFFAAIEAAHDFRIQTNHLILFGLCADCRASRADGAT
ncbi:Fur family transcriptional regulator [Thermanaerothrix sp.]|jgi:Fur family ferric uptake transcriptional regulator|uniref:Fur family transcriptional regulator n=1 Tax=Thermanaerothrix sp. TaxID=2972675 RepID=UPI002ADE5F63|nr:Fur family transcriptional regulator [Thermanaerothrix sp.]